MTRSANGIILVSALILGAWISAMQGPLGPVDGPLSWAAGWVDLVVAENGAKVTGLAIMAMGLVLGVRKV